jgi:septum formation protein
MTHKLILASGSEIRAKMLRDAGVEIVVERARIDEDMVKAALLDEGARSRDIADALAELKARKVAGRYDRGLVLGADQVLVCKGTLISKSRSRQDMHEQLSFLRGKAHELLSAVVVFEDGNPVWRKIGRVQLVMRNFSDSFLEDYLDRNLNDLFETVGCYRLEAEGIQLFEKVEGDYFTVLGLPLLDVLAFLRTRGVCAE